MAIDTTKLPAYIQALGRGVRKGATGRALGLEETGVKLANALGIDTGDARELLADAQKQNAAENSNGVYGTVGELLGDPVNYIGAGETTALKAGKLAKAIQFAKQGTKVGTVAGATEGTQDANSDLGDTALNTAIGAGTGMALGAGIPAIAGGAKLGAGILRGAGLRTGAAFGNDTARNAVASDILASKLSKNGLSPEEVQNAISMAQNSPLKPTLGESTQSPGVLGIEKTVLKGDDQAARTMRNGLYDRNVNQIPDAVRQQATPLSEAGSKASDLYAAASAESQNADIPSQETLFNDMQSMKERIKNRLGELGDVNNVEKRTLDQANTILSNAEKRGNSFDALHDAKKQLSDIFIEGGDLNAQKQANRATTPLVKTVDANLSNLAPENYNAAKSASMQGMAARDLTDALDTSREGGIRQLYNKVWATPEMREDFLRKVPEDQRQGFQDFFSQLENVSRGHAGSDTAFNLSAGKNLEGDLAGFNTNSLNPTQTGQSLFQRLTDSYTPGIKDKIAQISLNPTDSVPNSMVRQGKSVLDNPLLGSSVSLSTTDANQELQPEPPSDENPFSHLIPQSDNPFAHLIPQGSR